MPAPITLPIMPDDVSEDRQQRDLVLMAHEVLSENKRALFAEVPDDYEPMEAFFALTIKDALRYICEHTNRQKVLKAVQHFYDNPSGIVEDVDNDAEDVEEDTSSRKRPRKEKTTMQAQRSLVKRLNEALVQTVASDEDWVEARSSQVVTIEQQRYRDWVKRLPGIGVNAAARFISMGSAVGAMDCMRDWHAIATVWRRQNSYGKKLFQGVAVARTGVANSQLLPGTQGEQRLVRSQTQLATELNDPGVVDELGLTALETETFKERFFDAQKTAVDGIADHLRHRWKMDKLYEEFNRLESEIRRRRTGTGMRGRKYTTMAKEHLFTTTYQDDLGRLPTKDDDPEQWSAFGTYLDWGKRWNVLKQRFGTIGIFGILPRGANNFIEKTLSQARVEQWAAMVKECNADAQAMAYNMEPLFLACMEELEPPVEFAFLEKLDHLVGTRPLALFEELSSDRDDDTVVPELQLAVMHEGVNGHIVEG
ncbi:hypothetical protein NX059_012158 [Plenodomus lindquistii]|nr:hypothetical protein NX059_012158 [Plenodomus lindquistii]